MGIAPYIADAIIREHKHRPIEGDVVLLGRQAMLFSPDHAHDLLRAQGVQPVSVADQTAMLDRSTRSGAGNSYIKDSSFFELLGARATRTLDHSADEGAEIIHDLNTPLPADLESIADFLVDGSTLDNLFSPSTALQNITRMLRPEGRFISINMGSPHFSPYLILTPFWFYDYLALNKYADYRVYVTIHGRKGHLDVFTINPDDALNGPSFPVTRATGVVVFAEKGPETTWHRVPSQRLYAGQATLDKYASTAKRATGGRPELLRSKGPSSLGFSPFQNLLEHYSSAAFIAKNYLHIDHEGNRRQPTIPTPLTVAKWLRKRFAPDWLP
jgi:hypothetical protein